MPRVVFEPLLQRHVECLPCEVAGHSVREALSENEGDQWTMAATHLPPVYAVSFIEN